MDCNVVSPSYGSDLIAHTAALRRFALSRVNGHTEFADDLVQETLLRGWTHRDSFVEGTNLRAWLFTILRNAHVNHFRKTSRERVGLDDGWEQLLSSPPGQEDYLALMEVLQAIDLLPEPERTVLVNLGLEGRSHDEAAREWGCALGTVRSRLSRARELLRLKLNTRVQPLGVVPLAPAPAAASPVQTLPLVSLSPSQALEPIEGATIDNLYTQHIEVSLPGPAHSYQK